MHASASRRISSIGLAFMFLISARIALPFLPLRFVILGLTYRIVCMIAIPPVVFLSLNFISPHSCSTAAFYHFLKFFCFFLQLFHRSSWCCLKFPFQYFCKPPAHSLASKRSDLQHRTHLPLYSLRLQPFSLIFFFHLFFVV